MSISAYSDVDPGAFSDLLVGRVKRNSEAQAAFLPCTAARTGKIFLHPNLSPGSPTMTRCDVGRWPVQSPAGGLSARPPQDSMVQNIAAVAIAMDNVADQPRSFHVVGRTRSFMSLGLEEATMTAIMIGTEITALITADQ